jgi:hypothetical protein
MAKEWFYRSMSEVLGPFSPSEMRAFAAAGRVTADTQIRKGTEGKWVNASQVKGLLPEARSTPVAKSPMSSPPILKPATPTVEPAGSKSAATSRLTLALASVSVLLAVAASVFYWQSRSISVVQAPAGSPATPPPESPVAPVAIASAPPVDPVKDAAATFPAFAEKIASEFKKLAEEKEYTKYLADNKEFRYTIKISDKYTYDVKKTDSVLTPLVGEIKVTYQIVIAWFYNLGPINRPEAPADLTIEASFRDGQWQLNKELSAFVP